VSNYLISVHVCDDFEIEPEVIEQLFAAAGDEGFLVMTVSDRTKPLILGDWVDCIDEVVIFGNTVLGEWVANTINELRNREIDVVVVSDDDDEIKAPDEGFTL
jgi:hypothetical protein